MADHISAGSSVPADRISAAPPAVADHTSTAPPVVAVDHTQAAPASAVPGQMPPVPPALLHNMCKISNHHLLAVRI